MAKTGNRTSFDSERARAAAKRRWERERERQEEAQAAAAATAPSDVGSPENGLGTTSAPPPGDVEAAKLVLRQLVEDTDVLASTRTQAAAALARLAVLDVEHEEAERVSARLALRDVLRQLRPEERVEALTLALQATP